MNAKQHTEGPWKLAVTNQEDGEFLVFTGESPDMADAHVASIASVAGGLGYYSGDDETPARCFESEANARLIAAAPDLLEACEAAEQRITELSPAGYVASELWTIRAALAKAKGE